jgi:hypothetical protein
MQTFTREILIKAKPAEVFAALTNLDNASVLMPEIIGTEMISEGDFGVGTVWAETRKFKVLGLFPVKATANIEVSEYVAGKSYAVVSQDGDMWTQYRFLTAGAGPSVTRLTLIGEFKCTGKLEGNEKKEKWLANWCEKVDGALVERVRAFLESP